MPECPHIPFWRFPVSSDIFFQIRKPCSDPAPGAAGNLFENGSFPVPVNAFLCSRCAVRFVIYTVFQITQYMGKTFLMICSIMIKGKIMVMDQNPLIILRDSTFYPFMPFFSHVQSTGLFHPVSHRHIPDSSFRFSLHLYSLYA